MEKLIKHFIFLNREVVIDLIYFKPPEACFGILRSRVGRPKGFLVPRWVLYFPEREVTRPTEHQVGCAWI